MRKRGENIRNRKDGRREARCKEDSEKIFSIYGSSYKQVNEKRSWDMVVQRPFAAFNRQTFRQAQQLWSAERCAHLKPATVRRYEYLLQRHILPELGEMPLSRITAPVINLFLSQKIKSGRIDGTGGLSPAYARNILQVINAILTYAAEEKLCPPMESHIKKPSATSKQIPLLSQTQAQKLISTISTDPDATEIGILIALYAGLRIGEICALSWEDVDLENRVITVRHTVSRISASARSGQKSMLVLDSPKTASSLRTIPMCSSLHRILMRYKSHALSAFVVSTGDRFVSPRTYEYRFHRVLKKCQLPNIHFHALRHTFATRCVEQSVDIKSLSEILGHASETITLRTYIHSSMELKRLQLEKLSSCF